MHFAHTTHTNQVRPAAVQGLPRPWALTQAQFEDHTVLIGVDPVMVRGEMRLQAADDSGAQALQRLKELALRTPPPHITDAQAWVDEGVELLLSKVFADDAFVGTLTGIVHVVMFKRASVPEGMTSAEILRRVHMHSVEKAAEAGEPVPEAVLDEYRAHMERMHVLSSTSPKEVLH